MDVIRVSSVCDIALTFPALPENQIDRSYLLDTLDEIFLAGNDCIILEGVAEIGKTVLCAQYAQRHGDHCFSLFLGPYRDLSSHPAQIRFDLANQIHWFLRGTRIPVEQDVTPEYLHNMLHILQRKMREQARSAYFVVDGVEITDQRDATTLQYVLRTLLPLGLPRFKFLLSGDQSIIAESVGDSVRVRTQTVSFFSPAETVKYFVDLTVPSEVVSEIHKTTRGVPGRLATIRRLLDSGVQASLVLDAVGEAARDIFEPEWSRVASDSDAEISLLAALAFLPECRNVDVLSYIAQKDGAEVLSIAKSLSFLVVSQNEKEISFVSDAFQRFARAKLTIKESWAIQRAIDRLHGAQDPAEAIRLLPQYLAKTRDFDQLERLLDGSNIAAAVRATRAVAPVLATLDKVRTLAPKDSPEELGLRCVFSRCALAQALLPDHIECQIRAHVVSGKDADAISLANTAETDELRLLLLSMVVNEQQKKGRNPTEEVSREISRLSSAVDASALGERALDVAANIIQTQPDIAARITEAYAQAEGDSNALDRALVEVSLTAMRRAKDQSELTRIVSGVDKMAVSENQKNFSKRARILVSADSSEEVLLQVEGLATTGEKLFFIRQWVEANSMKPFAAAVALAACKLMLADSKYSPSAKVYKDLSAPLLFCGQDDVATALVSFLQGQCATARASGPIVDYFRLRFRIARWKAKWHGDSALLELMDDALEVDSVADIDTRAACYAWLVRCIEGVGEDLRSDLQKELMAYASSLLMQTIDALLIGCAEHDVAAKGAIQAVAAYSVEDALNITERLNTKLRRETAKLHVVEKYLEESGGKDYSRVSSVVDAVITGISNRGLRQIVATRFLEWVGDREGDISIVDVAAAWRFLSYVVDPDVAVGVSAHIVGRSSEDGAAGGLEKFRSTVLEKWLTIESDAHKVEAGHEAIVSMGSRGLATSEMLSAQLRQFLAARGGGLALQTSWRCLTILQGRGAAALAATKVLGKAFLEDLASSAENVGSAVDRCQLLGRCALLIARFDANQAREFVSDHLMSAVAEVTAAEMLTTDVEATMVDIAPALWLISAATLRQYITRMTYESRQAALDSTLDFLLNGKVPGEPWNRSNKRLREIREDVVHDALDLMNDVFVDSALSEHLCDLITLVLDPNAGARINRVQRANLAQRAREFAETRLPSKDGIAHNGYQILVLAHVLALSKAKQPEWEALLARARQIPNSSDRCYVLGRITPMIPSRLSNFRNSVMEEALVAWKSLPTLGEKALRFQHMFAYCRSEVGPHAKEMLSNCIQGIVADPDGGASARYRALVEIAHRIDEEWAASLVSSSDDDPAKSLLLAEGRKGVQVLDLRRRIVSPHAEGGSQESIHEVAAACYRELEGLNAGQVAAQDWHALVQNVNGCSVGNLAESYPVLALLLATFASRYNGTTNMGERARELVSYLDGAIALTKALMERGRVEMSAGVTAELDDEDPLQIVAGHGERNVVLAALEKWLSQQRPEMLEIIDPYLRPQEIVELLRMVARANAHCEVRILTSVKSQDRNITEATLRQDLEGKWAALNERHAMPSSVIHVVGRPSDGDMGIHDRWWLAPAAGIDMGTSFGGLGGKISRVRSLNAAAVAQVRSKVDPYFRMMRRSYDGERLNYMTVVI